jgi:hypothetical protein
VGKTFTGLDPKQGTTGIYAESFAGVLVKPYLTCQITNAPYVVCDALSVTHASFPVVHMTLPFNASTNKYEFTLDRYTKEESARSRWTGNGGRLSRAQRHTHTHAHTHGRGGEREIEGERERGGGGGGGRGG